MTEEKKTIKYPGGYIKCIVDKKELKKLASYGCTHKEMAEFFGVNVESMRKKYIKIIQAGRDLTHTPAHRGAKQQGFVDIETLKRLASYHCSYKEMAEFFGVKETLLREQYKSVIDEGKSDTLQRLRNAQLHAAIEKHNPTMLIWLGKQLLGQEDAKTISVAGEVNNTIKIEFVGNPQQALEQAVNSSDSINSINSINSIIDGEIINESPNTVTEGSEATRTVLTVPTVTEGSETVETVPTVTEVKE